MLKAAYINELYKISKKKKILVAAILSIGAVLIAGIILSSLNSFVGISVAGGGDFSLFVLSVLNYTLIPLFTAFICIDMFCGEYTGETIKMTITRPVSRFKIYLAKTLSAATFILVNLIFVMAVSVIMSFFVGSSTTPVIKVAVAHLVSFFPLMVFASMVIFVSNLVRGSAGAFMLSIVLFLASLGFTIGFQAYNSFFYTTSFNWHTLFMGTYINIPSIMRRLLILLGYGTAFFSGGYLLFERKNF